MRKSICRSGVCSRRPQLRYWHTADATQEALLIELQKLSEKKPRNLSKTLLGEKHNCEFRSFPGQRRARPKCLSARRKTAQRSEQRPWVRQPTHTSRTITPESLKAEAAFLGHSSSFVGLERLIRGDK